MNMWLIRKKTINLGNRFVTWTSITEYIFVNRTKGIFVANEVQEEPVDTSIDRASSSTNDIG